MRIAVAELSSAVGRHLGYSDWLTIEQDRIDRFTAAAGSDGYLALSLTNFFLPQILEVTGMTSGVNYGADHATFALPLAAGQRVRGAAQLLAADDIRDGVQTRIRITVEIEGSDEPACVVDSLSRWMV